MLLALGLGLILCGFLTIETIRGSWISNAYPIFIHLGVAFVTTLSQVRIDILAHFHISLLIKFINCQLNTKLIFIDIIDAISGEAICDFKRSLPGAPQTCRPLHTKLTSCISLYFGYQHASLRTAHQPQARHLFMARVAKYRTQSRKRLDR